MDIFDVMAVVAWAAGLIPVAALYMFWRDADKDLK
jgi:hypothetical protein